MSRLTSTLFVITYGRSGSTLLQRALNAIPGYLLRGENDNLLAHLVRCWLSVRDSEHTARIRARGHPSTPDLPWYGFEDIDPDTLGRQLAQVFTDTVLRPGPDTRVAGFKEIRWHADPDLFGPMMQFITLYFPNPRFIFNTRDHDQVARSGWWKSMSRDTVETELTTAETLFSAYQQAHPHQCLTLHYNDYIASLDPWRTLFDFLGEPFDAASVTGILDRKLNHTGLF